MNKTEEKERKIKKKKRENIGDATTELQVKISWSFL
jgi:hypothetical protein